MPSITINLSSEFGHWRIEFGVNGKVEPANIFACRSGLAPLLRGLESAQAQYNGITSLPEGHAGRIPPTVAVRMPSGRLLTFTLSSVESALPEVPKSLP